MANDSIKERLEEVGLLEQVRAHAKAHHVTLDEFLSTARPAHHVYKAQAELFWQLDQKGMRAPAIARLFGRPTSRIYDALAAHVKHLHDARPAAV